MPTEFMAALFEKRHRDFSVLAEHKHTHFENTARRLEDLAAIVDGRRVVHKEKLRLLAEDDVKHGVVSLPLERELKLHNRMINSEVRDIARQYTRQYKRQVRHAVEASLVPSDMAGYCGATLNVSILDCLARRWLDCMQTELHHEDSECDFDTLVSLSDADLFQRMHSLLGNFETETRTDSAHSIGQRRGSIAVPRTKALDQLAVELRKLASDYYDLADQAAVFSKVDVVAWRSATLLSLVCQMHEGMQGVHLKVLMENQDQMDVSRAIATKDAVDEFLGAVSNCTDRRSLPELCDQFFASRNSRGTSECPVTASAIDTADEVTSEIADQALPIDPETANDDCSVPKEPGSEVSISTLISETAHLHVFSDMRKRLCNILRKKGPCQDSQAVIDDVQRLRKDMAEATGAHAASVLSRSKSTEALRAEISAESFEKKLKALQVLVDSRFGSNTTSPHREAAIRNFAAMMKADAQRRVESMESDLAKVNDRLAYCSLMEASSREAFERTADSLITAATSGCVPSNDNHALRSAAAHSDVASAELHALLHDKHVAQLSADRIRDQLAIATGELRAIDSLATMFGRSFDSV